MKSQIEISNPSSKYLISHSLSNHTNISPGTGSGQRQVRHSSRWHTGRIWVSTTNYPQNRIDACIASKSDYEILIKLGPVNQREQYGYRGELGKDVPGEQGKSCWFHFTVRALTWARQEYIMSTPLSHSHLRRGPLSTFRSRGTKVDLVYCGRNWAGLGGR